MADIMFAECLKAFGLTGQEASIYEVLLRNSAMTGYELGKKTGISRSNVYTSLAGLVDKGAAYLIEGDPIRYVSVSVDEFCRHTMEDLQRKSEYLTEHVPEKEKPMNEGYITIQGSRHISDKIRDMMKACRERFYFLAEADVIGQFEKELEHLVEQGRKVVLMTEKTNVKGSLFYKMDVEPDQIRIIMDSSLVLTGEWRDSEFDTCLYSGQSHLVSIMKEALKNKISLMELYDEEQE